MFQVGHFTSHIGEYKKVSIVQSSRYVFDSFIGKFNRVLFFFDDKKERIGNQVHVFVILLHVEIFSFLEQIFHSHLAQEFDNRFVFR